MIRRSTRVATNTQLTELPDTVPACHALIHQLMQRLAMQEEQGNPSASLPAGSAVDAEPCEAYF
jgi:hypothetical protein